jgi:hypothetical protein
LVCGLGILAHLQENEPLSRWLALTGLAIGLLVSVLLVRSTNVKTLIFFPRFYFEKRSGSLVVRDLHRRRETSALGNITSVELIHEYDQGVPHFYSFRGHYIGFLAFYKVNEIRLICKGLADSKLCVACQLDREWTRAAGKKVAEFLGVPVVDQLSSESDEKSNGKEAGT